MQVDLYNGRKTVGVIHALADDNRHVWVGEDAGVLLNSVIYTVPKECMQVAKICSNNKKLEFN